MIKKHFIFIFSLIFLLISCGQKADFNIDSSKKIAAIGDSLTFGYGSDVSWPEYFTQKTGFYVENLGISGNTTDDVLNRIDKDLTEYKANIVFLSIGGNDFLRKNNINNTKSNLIKIIDKIQNKNIKIILISQPKPSIAGALGSLSDHEIYKDVAKEKNIILIEDLWSDILEDGSKKSDLIHANSLGYEEFADNLIKKLKQLDVLE